MWALINLTAALALSVALSAHAVDNSTVPLPTPTPVATVAPIVTPTPTPTPTAIATRPPPPAIASPPPVASPPPPSPPPPPPGAGSDKTALLSIVRLSGSDLRIFNATIGTRFQAALAHVLGIPSGSVLIRDWSASSGRRLLADNVAVTSAAMFGDGMASAAGLNTLKKADQSGALQAALRAEGLQVDSASVDSATTTLPSNFQPISPSAGRARLSLAAIIMIAIAGAVVLGLLAFCCCRQCFFCCPLSDEEERLPRMIKFGTKDGVKFFFNAQSFKTSPGLESDSKLEMQEVGGAKQAGAEQPKS